MTGKSNHGMACDRCPKPDLLEKLLEQHWLHCRHVEHERTWFLLTLVGSIAAIVGFMKPENMEILRYLILVPILLSVVGLLLTKRWGEAFSHHKKSVNEILSLHVTNVTDRNASSEFRYTTIDIPNKRPLLKTNTLFLSLYVAMLVLLVIYAIYLFIPSIYPGSLTEVQRCIETM